MNTGQQAMLAKLAKQSVIGDGPVFIPGTQWKMLEPTAHYHLNYLLKYGYLEHRPGNVCYHRYYLTDKARGFLNGDACDTPEPQFDDNPTF